MARRQPEPRSVRVPGLLARCAPTLGPRREFGDSENKPLFSEHEQSSQRDQRCGCQVLDTSTNHCAPPPCTLGARTGPGDQALPPCTSGVRMGSGDQVCTVRCAPRKHMHYAPSQGVAGPLGKGRREQSIRGPPRRRAQAKHQGLPSTLERKEATSRKGHAGGLALVPWASPLAAWAHAHPCVPPAPARWAASTGSACPVTCWRTAPTSARPSATAPTSSCSSAKVSSPGL